MGDTSMDFDKDENITFDTSKGVKVVSTFDSMGIREDLLRGLYSYGFEKPSAIQQRAIVPITQRPRRHRAGAVRYRQDVHDLPRALPDARHQHPRDPGPRALPHARARHADGEDRARARQLHERAGPRVHRRAVHRRRHPQARPRRTHRQRHPGPRLRHDQATKPSHSEHQGAHLGRSGRDAKQRIQGADLRRVQVFTPGDAGGAGERDAAAGGAGDVHQVHDGPDPHPRQAR